MSAAATRHTAGIRWQAGAEGFRKGRFSRDHAWHFDSGLEIQASASPAVVPAPWSDANALDPEQALVAALASCHMMSFLYLANRAGFDIDSYSDDAAGELGRRADGRHAMTRVTLRPQVGWATGGAPPAERQRELHDEAHALCFIANSVSCEIHIEPR